MTATRRKITLSQSVIVLCLYIGLPRVPGYPSDTRVINYPGNFLVPDGYPGSEYLICRIYLSGFSELVQ